MGHHKNPSDRPIKTLALVRHPLKSRLSMTDSIKEAFSEITWTIHLKSPLQPHTQTRNQFETNIGATGIMMYEEKCWWEVLSIHFGVPLHT